jgi:hypothetical protein
MHIYYILPRGNHAVRGFLESYVREKKTGKQIELLILLFTFGRASTVPRGDPRSDGTDGPFDTAKQDDCVRTVIVISVILIIITCMRYCNTLK